MSYASVDGGSQVTTRSTIVVRPAWIRRVSPTPCSPSRRRQEWSTFPAQRLMDAKSARTSHTASGEAWSVRLREMSPTHASDTTDSVTVNRWAGWGARDGYGAAVTAGEQGVDAAVLDGRRARRDRNRTAVVEAVYALLHEGFVPPSTEAVAERAGVSVSSVFRYFDGLDDLQKQTIELYFERCAPLFAVPALGEGTLEARIATLVGARLALYRDIAPIARLARMRAPEYPLIADTLAGTRATLLGQVRHHFAPELRTLGRAEAGETVALIDVLTSYESWDLMRVGSKLSERRITTAWTQGIRAVLHGVAS